MQRVNSSIFYSLIVNKLFAKGQKLTCNVAASQTISAMVTNIAFGARGPGLVSRAGLIGRSVGNSCDVSLKRCCPIKRHVSLHISA